MIEPMSSEPNTNPLEIGDDVSLDMSLSGDIEAPEGTTTGNYGFLSLKGPGAWTVLTTWLVTRRQNIRPWFEFIQTNNFKAPSSIPNLTKRIVKNIEYFHSNYLIVFLALTTYCLLTSPLLLIAVVGSLYASYRLGKKHEENKIKIFGRELTTLQLYGLVQVCSFPVYYIIGVGAIIFWVLGASFFVISLHTIFYNIQAIEPDGEETFNLMTEIV